MFVVGPYCIYKVVLVRKPLIITTLITPYVSEQFCDDFDITDEILSGMYLFSLYLQ